MSLHTKIYSLEERNENDISATWQWIQVVFYLCCVVLAVAISYCFSSAGALLHSNCVLYSNIVFYSDEVNKTTTNINLAEMQPMYHCDVVIYIPIVIVAYSSFFMILFIICGRGGAGNGKFMDPWRIVFPTVIFNLICFCFALFVSGTFHGGIKYTLNNIASSLHLKRPDLTILQDLQFDNKRIGSEIFTYLLTTKHALWLFVPFWGLNFFWILLRCIFNVDFTLVRTDIYVYPTKSILVKAIHDGEVKPSESVTDLSRVDVDKEDIEKGPQLTYVRSRKVHFNPDPKLDPSNPT